MWIDAHCHVQAPFTNDIATDVALEHARAAGVEAMVCVGTDLASSLAAIELAHAAADVWATVGLHPHDATAFDAEWDALVACASDERVVAIGEAGFDLYYEHSPHAEQEHAFRRQIALAHALDAPLVIHSRDAWDDTFRVLRAEGVPRRTVFHCFTGGPTEVERALGLGCHVSFSGIVSFKTADELRAAARLTPPDRLLVETDAPYLAPVPMRGRTNEPAHVALVGAALAAARDEPVEAIAATTSANARTFFGISPAVSGT